MINNDRQKQTISILYLITELNVIGGAEKLMPRLLSHLDRKRFFPTVVCLHGGDGPVADEIRALGIPIVDLGMTAKWRLDALRGLYLLLRRERPSILHASLFHANIAARVLGRAAGVPVIITWRHGVEIGGTLRESINRWTSRLDDKVVATCNLVRQIEVEHARVPPDKVTTIYNGIDMKDFPSNPGAAAIVRQTFDVQPDSLLIGTIGRLHRAKGLPDLLSAMVRVQEYDPEARLLLVGGGELREELETQAETLGLSNAVIFAGIRNNIPEILGALDLFVLPSLWEGLPLVLLEAMAAGLPVVATAVGGTPEVVVDGVTGLLVPPHDPQSLAQAIIRLLGDPDLRRRMGQAGRERVERHFTVERMVRETESLYEMLLREKGYC